MDSINFPAFPLVVQETVVEKILLNLQVADCFEFSKTSEYCLWLMQRVRTKKVIKYAEVVCFGDGLTLYLDGKKLNLYHSSTSEDQLKNLLSFVEFRTLRITEDFFKWKNFGYFANSWAKAVKNVRKLCILSYISERQVTFLLSMIETLESLEIHEEIYDDKFVRRVLEKMQNIKCLFLMGKMDDKILDLIASKSSPEKPIQKCHVYSFDCFTTAAYHRFLQNVHCAENADLMIRMFEG
uniref:F-box domain-containing protein n=1 Tax=Panagrolaimus sp. JU765 TaxID=591449 RepID=A0AC34R6N7_9BILA